MNNRKLFTPPETQTKPCINRPNRSGIRIPTLSMSAILLPALMAFSSLYADFTGLTVNDPAGLEAAGLEAAEFEEMNLRGVEDGTNGVLPEANLVEAEIIAIEEQAAGGSTITGVRVPTTNSSGDAGFNGTLFNDDIFIWSGTGVVWLNSSADGFTLTSAEQTMGISDNGNFIYSPSVDGDDAVWTDKGLLLVEETQAPGFPAGTISTFHSRPSMIDSGRAFWVSGFNESDGTATEGRMLYTSSDGTAANATVVLRSDDVIQTFTIDRPSGIDFDYDFSENGQHHIHVLLMDTGSTIDDGFVYVDGSLVAREGSPSGSGSNWDNFDLVSINNAGDFVFSGDTDGSTASDEFIAANGEIAIREGDVVDGITLTSSAAVNALSIAENGSIAFIWRTADAETLFAACSPDNLRSAVALVSTGDDLDFDGDQQADATLLDFLASTGIGTGINLAPDGSVVLEVDLDVEGDELEAIVRLDFDCDRLLFEDGFEPKPAPPVNVVPDPS